MEKAEIIQFIKKSEALVVTSTYLIGYLLSPKREQADVLMFGSTFNRFTTHSKTGSREFWVDEAVSNVKADIAEALFMSNSQLMSAVVFIHDLITNSAFNKRTPEFEFLRHLRNAFSHGNRFYITKEPTLPAEFNGFKIEYKLNGISNVLPDIILPGDILDLFAFLKENL
jgi:hypothetical protein